MLLLLIGLRGCGKSTIGRLLAGRLGLGFVDLDERTLRQLHAADVASAWRAHGQEAFRLAEVEALRQATACGQGVIALGGGTPTAPGAVPLIKRLQSEQQAIVVYLRCEPDELEERLRQSPEGADANRPGITGDDPLAEIPALFAQRDTLYRSIADYVLDNQAKAEDAQREIERLVNL